MIDDLKAVEELLQASKPGALHAVLHYLYLPSEQAAAEVAARLRSHGFTTEERRGADGVNWLVLAKHKIIPSGPTILTTRKLMEGLTAPFAGEYDGWEAEVLR